MWRSAQSIRDSQRLMHVLCTQKGVLVPMIRSKEQVHTPSLLSLLSSLFSLFSLLDQKKRSLAFPRFLIVVVIVYQQIGLRDVDQMDEQVSKLVGTSLDTIG